MRVITLRMEEEMVRKLEELARLHGVTRSALIKEILREALVNRSAGSVGQALLAMREGRKPGKEIDWTKIEKELRETSPYFPTVEEAIAYSRKRP